MVKIYDNQLISSNFTLSCINCRLSIRKTWSWFKPRGQVVKIGILEPTTLHFSHLTFLEMNKAEYFVAQFVPCAVRGKVETFFETKAKQ